MAIVPWTFNPNATLIRINHLHPTIKFTIKKRKVTHFLIFRVIFHGTNEGWKFSVYRKPTNEDDCVLICQLTMNEQKWLLSSDSFTTRKEYLVGSFFYRKKNILGLPFLSWDYQALFGKGKADVYQNKKSENRLKTITSPAFPHALVTRQKIALSIKVALQGCIKIGNLCRPKHHKIEDVNSVVYMTPCGACLQPYYREICNGLKHRGGNTQETH